MNMRPAMWWLVLVVILLSGIGVAALLWAQGFGRAANWVGFATIIPLAAWVVFGLFRWNEHPWVRRLTAMIVATIAAALTVSLSLALGSVNSAIAASGIYAMAVVFFLGVHGLRLVLSPGYAVTGVARTLVDEAIRMKVPLIFIVVLLLIVPTLPFVLDAEQQLRYRIQTFLTWSMTATGLLLSLMTVFLAVGTITSEMGNRQIFLTMTKPVSRGQYLLGKWLGIMALNLVLVVVAGGAVYLFTMLLARQPATSPYDAMAVREQVLVARNAVSPQPQDPGLLPQAFRERIERLRQTEPQTYGAPGAPIDALPTDIRQRVQQQLITEFHSLPPRGAVVYRFTRLGDARQLGPLVQLRITPRAAGQAIDGLLHLGITYNGYIVDEPVWRLVEGQSHVLDVPSELITEQGVLDVRIHNVAVGGQNQPSISFDPGDGLQLLYRVGGFEANFARSLLVLWIRLGFLAMLGLAAGTYLSFPVACLLTLLIYFTAVGSSYLNESLEQYAVFPQEQADAWERLTWVPATLVEKIAEGEVWEGIKIVVRLIGSGFMMLVPSFAEYNPTPLLADGRAVSLRLLGNVALWVGVVWTGTIGVIAWLIFRHRELARVTV
jgi:hypothetical protein